MAGREPLNEQDFMKMQQDAIERVREMQARARRTLAENGIPLEPAPGDVPPSSPTAPPAVPAPTAAAQPSAAASSARSAHSPQADTPSGRPAAPQSSRPAPSPQRPGGRTPPAYARLGHTLRPTLREFPINPPEEEPPAPEPAHTEPVHPESAHSEHDPLRALFHLSIDSEQIMLLGILYLLYKDHGDPYLMMALAYLLLG